MSSRQRYLDIAAEFEAAASQIDTATSDTIAEQTQRGVWIGEGIRETAQALAQIPPLVREMIVKARRGDDVDLAALRAFYDRYVEAVRKIGDAINASLPVN